MRTSSRGFTRQRTTVSTALGLLLVAVAATPAHADSVRSMQWHLDAMKAEQMWATSRGQGVTVAVIDSGVDPSNPDLEGQVLTGKDLAPEASGDEHTDYNGHGTSMAGLIAGTGQREGETAHTGSLQGPRSSLYACRSPVSAQARRRRTKRSTKMPLKRFVMPSTTTQRSSTFPWAPRLAPNS